jgi:hypothetical protein
MKQKYGSVLPIEIVEEFETGFLKSRDAETKKGRWRTSHARSKWKAAQRMIVALKIDPSEWYYYNKEIYDYFYEHMKLVEKSIKQTLIGFIFLFGWD